ncbi:MAG: hypothetical protein ACRDMJ_09065 [Solirubrobacteraceae bacterium]
MRTTRAMLRSKLPAPLRRPAGERQRGDGPDTPEPRRAPKRSLNEAAHKLDR